MEPLMAALATAAAALFIGWMVRAWKYRGPFTQAVLGEQIVFVVTFWILAIPPLMYFDPLH